MSEQRFTPLQRLLHWLLAVCILAMLFIGVGMASTVAPKYLPLLAIHKSLGITILVLALIRLAVRMRNGAPKLPADLPAPQILAARLSHFAFYVLMIGMPLIGWFCLLRLDPAASGGRPVPFAGPARWRISGDGAGLASCQGNAGRVSFLRPRQLPPQMRPHRRPFRRRHAINASIPKAPIARTLMAS
jgi:hypothetical protein